MALVAKVNIHGPASEEAKLEEGGLVRKDTPIPNDWPPEFVESLVASGGAGEPEQEG